MKTKQIHFSFVIIAALIVYPCRGPAAVRYVDEKSGIPIPPYLSWATAATVIQDAVDAAEPGDEVLVNDGIYATGGRAVFGLTNRVYVDKPLTLRSANGPQFTIIRGHQVPGTTNGAGAIRCVYLQAPANLFGFTLTNGATLETGLMQYVRGGGGVLGSSALTSLVSNCVLVGNSAHADGGGAYSAMLSNCTLTGNTAGGGGGGAADSRLNTCTLMGNAAAVGGGTFSCNITNCTLAGNMAGTGGGAEQSILDGCILTQNIATTNGGGANLSLLSRCAVVSNTAASFGGGVDRNLGLNGCTIVGNSAQYGGGVYMGGLTNCIVYYNTAQMDFPNYVPGSLTYCCSSPLPNGVGNISAPPAFVDLARGNLRLQTNSPCIDAGISLFVGSADLDGRPRIVGARVDMGAYEFQGPTIGEFTGWLDQYDLMLDGSVDYADSDGDGMTNWDEWRAGTVPTNAASALRLLTPRWGVAGLAVSWQSVTNRSYYLQRAVDLGGQQSFSTLQSNLVGHTGVTTYSDTTAVGVGPYFYRVCLPK